jgi:hypothetical protein
MPHRAGICIEFLCTVDPALCGIALDHDPPLCRIALDLDPALCGVALDKSIKLGSHAV